MYNEIKIYCKQCYKPLGINSIDFYRTAYMGELVDGGRKAFCNEKCYEKYLSKYFVEEYKSNKIYWILLDSKKCFIPYVNCHYSFPSVNDVKKFIDARIEEVSKWKGKFIRHDKEE